MGNISVPKNPVKNSANNLSQVLDHWDICVSCDPLPLVQMAGCKVCGSGCNNNCQEAIARPILDQEHDFFNLNIICQNNSLVGLRVAVYRANIQFTINYDKEGI